MFQFFIALPVLVTNDSDQPPFDLTIKHVTGNQLCQPLATLYLKFHSAATALPPKTGGEIHLVHASASAASAGKLAFLQLEVDMVGIS
ncbi:hypothetical protein SAMN03159422_05188 [Agrobacterium fabrum]|uniref:hypothetical protein n=1 Tax=Agrobacterium fabrum TaxID=1176649 RepID=UPI00088CA844|nr:hypothetical protein [Agrobacterium fabrum]SDB74262.1 hypothetical protein SAMN03159422_05188 [Agrobacterium fabrum]SES22101.1 hypothetical protein SAMN03159504_05161 [Agrobacterium fabrum]